MGRRRVVLCALAVAAAAIASTGSPAAAADNLLANPGFEDPLPGHPWMPAGWDTTQAGLPTVFFGRDTVLRRSGQYAINVASASGVWAIEHGWSQSRVVGPDDWGKDLVLTVWTRSIGVDGRAYVVLQALRDSVGKMARTWKVDRDVAGRRLGINRMDEVAYLLGWQRIVFTEPETDWVKRELRIYVAPGTDVVTARAGILGVGQIYLDDATLTEEAPLVPVAPEQGVNLITDPSFEGDLTDWEVSRPPFPGLSITQVTDVVRTGEKALLLTGTAGLVIGRSGVAQPFCNRALAGKRIRLTGYAKAESLITSAYARIYCHGPHGIEQEVSTVPVSGTMDWTEMSAEMDVPEDTYAVWAWLAYSAPSKGRVWFDDARLEVLGPARAAKATAGKP